MCNFFHRRLLPFKNLSLYSDPHFADFSSLSQRRGGSSPPCGRLHLSGKDRSDGMMQMAEMVAWSFHLRMGMMYKLFANCIGKDRL